MNSQSPSRHVNTTLAQALKCHGHGSVRKAERLYRKVLRDDPTQSIALQNLSRLLLDQEKYPEAIRLAANAIARQPGNTLFELCLADALCMNGDYDAAIHRYGRALQSSEKSMAALLGRARAHRSKGDVEGAVADLRLAISMDPGFPQPSYELANLLRTDGRLDQVLEVLEALVERRPNDADAHLNLGNFLKELGEFDRARAEYRFAENLLPHSPLPYQAMAYLLLELGDYDGAHRAFYSAFVLRHGRGFGREELFVPHKVSEEAGGKLVMSAFYFENMIGHIGRLIEGGRLHPSFRKLVELYGSVQEGLDFPDAVDCRITVPESVAAAIRPFCHLALHYAPPGMIPSRALAGDPGDYYRRLEDDYLGSSLPCVVLDNALSQAALEGLREFCLDSTIYFQQSPSGFLFSHVHDGFSCPLLYQIAAELKQNFPRVLGGLPLKEVWAYRYPHSGDGVRPHTDQAAVTVNFWITEQSANERPDSGGLVVYAKEQSLDVDWFEQNYNKHDEHMRHQIAVDITSSAAITIPYMENRAVIFRSNLYHQTDEYWFRDDYTGRRLNVTLLFGARGSD